MTFFQQEAWVLENKSANCEEGCEKSAAQKREAAGSRFVLLLKNVLKFVASSLSVLIPKQANSQLHC